MERYEKYKESDIEWVGEIPEHWEVKKIKHFCYVKGRVGWKGLKSSDFLQKGYAYLVTGTDFKTNRINWEKCYNIDQKRYEEDPYIQLKNDDLLITKDGTIGKLAIVDKLDKPACLNSGIFVVRSLDQQLSTQYLYWVLYSDVFKKFNGYTTYGSTIQHLYQNVFVDFSYTLPSIIEQFKISNYLKIKTKEIDELIAQKVCLLELYEKEKEVIINQAVTKGIDPDVRLKDSGIAWLGEIPEHWKLTKIGYSTTIVRGASPRPAGSPRYFNGDFMPWITVKEVTNAIGKNIKSTETFLTEEGSKLSRIIQPETLLLSNSGATLGVPKIAKIEGCINDGSGAFINFESNLLRDFLYWFFVSHTQIYREKMKGNG